MREMVGETQEDQVLMARAALALLYRRPEPGGDAKRLGLTRARVNKLLADARDSGLVSITINPANVGLLPVEEAIRLRHSLDFCICTPALGHDADPGAAEALLAHSPFARSARPPPHICAATLPRRRRPSSAPAGRTMEQMTLQLAGVSAPQARFISLMGSLTSNLAYNPFEVVHAFARTTGAEGILPARPLHRRHARGPRHPAVAAIRPAGTGAGTGNDRGLCLDRRAARSSLLRSQGMISARELEELRKLGAVGDTNGFFFDADGQAVDHPLNRRAPSRWVSRSCARPRPWRWSPGDPSWMRRRGFLASGAARGLIIDGDTATELAATM